MIRAGKMVCDICHLVINPLQKSVRVQRPETVGDSALDFAHFHARDSTDCFYRTLEKAKALQASRKPTTEDVRQYELFLQQTAIDGAD